MNDNKIPKTGLRSSPKSNYFMLQCLSFQKFRKQKIPPQFCEEYYMETDKQINHDYKGVIEVCTDHFSNIPPPVT